MVDVDVVFRRSSMLPSQLLLQCCSTGPLLRSDQSMTIIFVGVSFHLLIIIMKICKAPTLRLKALNKHTQIMYIEMETVIKNIKRDGWGQA